MPAPVSTVLVADDDQYIRDDLTEILRQQGYRVVSSGTAAETWQKVLEDKPHLVLLDIKFPDCEDLSLLRRLRAEHADMEVIIVSSQSFNVPQVVEAIKLGAYDYIAKPLVPEELCNRVARALELRHNRRSQTYLLKELQELAGMDTLIGDSSPMRNARETIRKLAEVDACVLIRGESGTGKELAARALHYLSKRAGNPFVIVNCSSIPEALVESILFGHKRGAFTGAVDSVKGRFEVAEEGTVFLDEIGDMPVSQQSSLLRVLEYRRFTPVGDNRERECRARFVLATNRDLREGVREGTFREDLFYRVNVATVQMPPLRARPEDIPALVDHYHRRISAEMGRVPGAVHPEVIRLFQQYDWPGNVRELKNVIEAALMLRDRKEVEITPRDLPPELLAVRAEGSPTGPALSPQERQEKQELIRALQQCQWNQTKAAQVLGCHRNTVRARLRYFGLSGRPEE